MFWHVWLVGGIAGSFTAAITTWFHAHWRWAGNVDFIQPPSCNKVPACTNADLCANIICNSPGPCETTPGSCTLGSCQYPPLDCNSPGQCEAAPGSCYAGQCTYPAAPNLSTCGDGSILKACDPYKNCVPCGFRGVGRGTGWTPQSLTTASHDGASLGAGPMCNRCDPAVVIRPTHRCRRCYCRGVLWRLCISRALPHVSWVVRF